jgi:hypothetical protein
VSKVSRTPPVSLDELADLSKTLRRSISGDIEWTATQFREFMNEAGALCNAVDRFVDQKTPCRVCGEAGHDPFDHGIAEKDGRK